jgi:hypothetical protein
VRELVERVLGHEHDDFAVLADTERQTNRGGHYLIVIGRVALEPQYALAVFTGYAGACFGYTTEDQYTGSLVH